MFILSGVKPAAPSLYLQACQLADAGDSQKALLLLDEARKADPDHRDTYLKMAALFEAMGLPQSAEPIYLLALKKFSGDAAVLNAAGNFYYTSDQCAKGYAFTRPAVQAPDCPPELIITHANLAKAIGKTEEAQGLYLALLQRAPDNVFALTNLGGLYLDEGRYAQAIDCLLRAEKEKAGNTHIATQLAHAFFRSGQLEKGWTYYAQRFGSSVKARPFSGPLWNGEELKDQLLLLWAEQGIGEEILYASMLKDAVKRASRISVECDPRLAPLFSRSFPGLSFFARQDPPDARLAKAAAQASLGHLGALFRTSADAFPKTPYCLVCDADKKERLREKYLALKKQKNLSGKLIGISWKSQKLRQGDPKSTDFAVWENLFEGSPHLFINLQYGDCSGEAALAGARDWNLFTDAAIDQSRSLDDYAAQIAALDQVITVSNSTAHMAGALGVKTDVLLPKARGLMWHWFDGTASSPWYPSLTLLRQDSDGDWNGPLEKSAQRLEA